MSKSTLKFVQQLKGSQTFVENSNRNNSNNNQKWNGGLDLNHYESLSFLEQIITKQQQVKQSFTNNDNNYDNGNSRDVLDTTIAGEYNSGESTLINPLLGTKFLDTGVLPTTDTITVLTSKDNNNKRNK